jgi:inositol-pentakisphosphate 2-kinase
MSDIAQTLPSHWKYVSEGGATIVFSYVGPPDASYNGMVLRLRKAVDNSAPAVPTNEEEPDDPIIEYQTRCIERLFPSDNLPQLRSVRLERTWLERLAKEHDSKRPEVRSGKDHIDLSRRKGVLATDLVGGEWIAVEIKVSSSASQQYVLLLN